MAGYNGPVRMYVNTLANVLSGLTGREFEGTYAASGGGTLRKLDELGVGRLISENLFNIYSFTSDSLVDGEDIFSDDQSSSIVSSLIHLPDRQQDQQNFELGFGMGNGFQLYCDSTMILTAGGGGGGGIYWNSNEQMTTFGGGGGGGVQFLSTFGQKDHSRPDNNSYNETGAFMSIGGGGGCGTCPENNRTSSLCSTGASLYSMESSVICGDSSDEDAISVKQFRHILKKQFNHHTFRKYCAEVSVFGGGGGGGGEVTCHHESGGGFGFYFHLSSKPAADSASSNKHKGNRVEEIPYQEGSASAASSANSTAAASDWGAYRDFGQLVQAAVGRCEGYSNWACVCAKSRVILHDCAEYGTVDRIDGVGPTSGIVNSTVLSEVPDWSAVNCTTFNHYNVSFHRILESSCSSFPSSSNGTDVHSYNDTSSDNGHDNSSDGGCGSADNIVFTTLQTLSSGSTHNLTFYAGKSDTNHSYLHRVLSSYPQYNATSHSAKFPATQVEPLLGSAMPPNVSPSQIAPSWVCFFFVSWAALLFLRECVVARVPRRDREYVEIL